MITKDEILKLVTNITKHNNGIKSRKLINPEREWAIGLLVASIILIAGFWYNAITFSYYNNLEKNLINETVNIPNYNYGTLSNVLTKYEERKRQFDEIRSGIVPVPDMEPPKETVIIIENPVVTPESTENTEEATTTDEVEGPSLDPVVENEAEDSDEPLVF